MVGLAKEERAPTWTCCAVLSSALYPLSLILSGLVFSYLGCSEGVRCCIGGCCVSHRDRPALQVLGHIKPPRSGKWDVERAEVGCGAFCCVECLIYARAVQGEAREVDITIYLNETQKIQFGISLPTPGLLDAERIPERVQVEEEEEMKMEMMEYN
jgi:hypothetical protein